MKELIERIQICKKCEIEKQTKNKSIGRGSQNPKVLFVGLNPGKVENETGSPFTGASGDLLDDWIDYLELKSEDYAVINIVKCFTPNEAELKGYEIDNCFHFFQEQVELLDPDYVIMLGKGVIHKILKTDESVLNLAGRIFRLYDTLQYYIALPHPSFFLHQGRNDWLRYLAKVKQFLDPSLSSSLSPSPFESFYEAKTLYLEKLGKEEIDKDLVDQRYVPVHLHTTYSVTDSITKMEDLAKRASKMGFKALAITDHGTISGWMEFQEACERYNIKPLLGIEFYIASDYNNTDTTRYHAVAIAKNENGIKSLFKLNDLAHRKGYYYKPRILLEHLIQYGNDLVVTGACTQGIVAKKIVDDEIQDAYVFARSLKERFGDDFYLELQPHDFPEQDVANEGVFKIAKELNIPLIITTDCHYLNKEDKRGHDALKAIAFRKKMGEAGFTIDTNYLMSDEELQEIMVDKIDKSELIECFQNTLRIATKCNAKLKRYKNALPKFEEGEDVKETLS
jgi:uracil-DNA glycosylase family 4